MKIDECIQRIAGGAKDAGAGAVGLAAELIDEGNKLVKKGKELVEQGTDGLAKLQTSIDKQGGLAAIVEKATDTVMGGVYDNYEAMRTHFKDTYFTGGKLDPEKVRHVLGNTGKAANMFGAKTGSLLTTLAKEGASHAKQHYRDLVPTKIEMETTYAGIGSQYNGFLLKPTLDSCLEFYNSARAALPIRLNLRPKILGDIKASASGNVFELTRFYELNGDDLGRKKVVSLEHYLSRK